MCLETTLLSFCKETHSWRVGFARPEGISSGTFDLVTVQKAIANMQSTARTVLVGVAALACGLGGVLAARGPLLSVNPILEQSAAQTENQLFIRVLLGGGANVNLIFPNGHTTCSWMAACSTVPASRSNGV